jgi:ribonuclease HII
MIIGIDEAGRGPLAGPVCAAAVILTEHFYCEYLDDSKKLTPLKREMACQYIRKEAATWGIGWASHTEIDDINILQASLLAMKRAFEEMTIKRCIKFTPDDKAIVDGLYTPAISIHCEAMVKADAKIPEVMAASILAKTARDRYMIEMAKLYPHYGYDKHKGYPVKAHREAVLKYGPSPIQRLSFRVK